MKVKFGVAPLLFACVMGASSAANAEAYRDDRYFNAFEQNVACATARGEVASMCASTRSIRENFAHAWRSRRAIKSRVDAAPSSSGPKAVCTQQS